MGQSSSPVPTMKSASIVSVSLFALLAACSALPNYCDLCSNHIGCGNNGTLAAACPSGSTKMVVIGEALRAKIVDSHNQKRSLLASGGLPGFSPAERMPTMQWNTELAYLAALNVRTCVFKHDACRKTNTFQYSGQNLGKTWWTGAGSSDEDNILGLCDQWWNEYEDASQSDIDEVSSITSSGHFTVMASDRNIAVGCAAIKFPDQNASSLTLACNYATTNIIGSQVYKSGIAASQCLTGSNPNYSGLCSTQEIVDPNDVEGCGGCDYLE